MHHGLIWNHKTSLWPEVDRVLREGADVNAADAVGTFVYVCMYVCMHV